MSDFSFKGSGGLVAGSDSKKNRKKWHTLLCMSLFFCNFAADLEKEPTDGTD